jgi:hypothetical protein
MPFSAVSRRYLSSVRQDTGGVNVAAKRRLSGSLGTGSKLLLVLASYSGLLAVVGLFTPWPIGHYTRRHRCGPPLFVGDDPGSDLPCDRLYREAVSFAKPLLIVAGVLIVLALSLHLWAVLRAPRAAPSSPLSGLPAVRLPEEHQSPRGETSGCR